MSTTTQARPESKVLLAAVKKYRRTLSEKRLGAKGAAEVVLKVAGTSLSVPTITTVALKSGLFATDAGEPEKTFWVALRDPRFLRTKPGRFALARRKAAKRITAKLRRAKAR